MPAYKKLSVYLEEDHVPRRAAIHSCIDGTYTTGARQTLASGVRTLYTNDKAAYEAKSEGDLWDSSTSKVSDSIEFSKIDIKVGGSMNAPVANTRMKVELVIPDTVLGEIIVDSKTIEFARNGVDIDSFIPFPAYNGPSAATYGFQVYLTAENGSVDVWDKSIGVRA